MGAEAEGETPSSSPSLNPVGEEDKGKAWKWSSYTAEDLKRTVSESTDSAIRSARSLQENSSTHLQTLQDFIPKATSQYKYYEDTLLKKVKDELKSAREHPTVAGGVAVGTALLLLRGPRRFLFRQTFGRLRTEEALYNKVERNMKDLNLDVDIMKNESKKLLERTTLAEEEMKRGRTQVRNAGSDIRRLAKTVYRIECQAADLMNNLREIPGRGALKLRAEVASMSSEVKQQRVALDKRLAKISDLGVAV